MAYPMAEAQKAAWVPSLNGQLVLGFQIFQLKNPMSFPQHTTNSATP